VLALFTLTLVLAAPSAAGADARGVHPAAPNPLAGLPLFVDHQNPAWRQYRREVARGRTQRAALIWRVAGQPKFRWFGRFNRNAGAEVRAYIGRARAAGQVPLIATLRHQGKRCGRGYTGGGRREDARTRRWYRAFARAIGRARVVIAFEPDSLGTVNCLKRSRRDDRLRLLRYGVERFAELPNATVYLEGGASDWEPAARTAKLLRRVGVDRVRGFMVNVTHYDWTSRNIAYGRAVSRRIGGKPFVVSTAFNGRGPVHYRRWYGPHRWRRINVHCHPLRRGLGPAPTTATADPKVDAYLWIGRPGYSGGSCNGGPLPVGTWWAKRAFMFARNATGWLGPPAGTRYGFPRGLSLRSVAGDQTKR
jgi:endoglucanase